MHGVAAHRVMCHWAAENRGTEVSTLPLRPLTESSNGGPAINEKKKRKSLFGGVGVVERGGGAMAREPPPRRNDAALLSKIASQEKLRAKLPPFLHPPPVLPPPIPVHPCRPVPSAGIDTMAPGIRRVLR